MIDNKLLNIRTNAIQKVMKNTELIIKHYFHTNKYCIIDQKCFYACVKTRTENLPIHACGYLWHQKYNIVNKNHTRCVFHLLPIVYYKIFLGLHSTILHRKYLGAKRASYISRLSNYGYAENCRTSYLYSKYT